MKTPVKVSINSGSLFFSETNEVNAGANALVDEPVALDAVDLAIDIAIPNTAGRLKLMAFKAVAAPMTIKITDAANALVGPSASYTLAAGESFIWPISSGDAAPAWVDQGAIAKFLVTNDSGTVVDPAAPAVAAPVAPVAGALQAIVLFDPTA